MTEVQAYFRIPIKDWLLLDNCCRWAIGTIEQKPELGKEQLNYKDEHYKKWIESVRINIQDQVQESTSDADRQEFSKQLEYGQKLTEDFPDVMSAAQFAVFKDIISESIKSED